MTHCKWACLILTLLSGTIHAEDKQPAKPERKTSFNGTELGSAMGTVLAVTKDSILMTVEKGAPKTFPMHDFLAAGKVHKLVMPADSYLLSDVKVGDIVDLRTFVENKVTYCVSICIHERPGGVIPAGQVVHKERTYHEVRNAKIALRDKGTPIPEHLKPKTGVVIHPFK